MGVTIIDKCIERADGSTLCYDERTREYYVSRTDKVSVEDITKEELVLLMNASKKVFQF